MNRPNLRLRFSFEGTFRPEDATRAVDQLDGAAPGALVSLDFTHCPHVDAGGVARLAEAIVKAHCVLKLCGLSRHDLRILHYLVGPTGEAPGEAQE
jgi:ABC-type transporter Mla MlaB component